MALEQAVALGSAAGYGTAGKVMGYPGGEDLTPHHTGQPVIAEGTEVLDLAGEKVGEVGGLSVTADNGSLTHIVLRQGMLFKRDTELPLAWVANLSDVGVMLNVPKHEVEALAEGA